MSWENSAPNCLAGHFRYDRQTIEAVLEVGEPHPIYARPSGFGRPVTVTGDDVYLWRFFPVRAEATEGLTPVQGIWSGRVAGQEYIVAACSGHLWSLTEQDGVWTKTDLGTLPTPGRVAMFGYGEKLYILNGEEYYVWDGDAVTRSPGTARSWP